VIAGNFRINLGKLDSRRRKESAPTPSAARAGLFAQLGWIEPRQDHQLEQPWHCLDEDFPSFAI
jgi:hypothetical protein